MQCVYSRPINWNKDVWIADATYIYVASAIQSSQSRLCSSYPKGHPPNPRGTWGNLGDIRGGVACWRTKAAISLKRVKIDEKLLWRAYRKSPTLFRTVPSPTPTASPSPRMGVHNPTPKLQSLLSSGTAKAMDCKFGRYIHRVQPNTSAEKFWRKSSVGVSRDFPIFLSTPY